MLMTPKSSGHWSHGPHYKMMSNVQPSKIVPGPASKMAIAMAWLHQDANKHTLPAMFCCTRPHTQILGGKAPVGSAAAWLLHVGTIRCIDWWFQGDKWWQNNLWHFVAYDCQLLLIQQWSNEGCGRSLSLDIGQCRPMPAPWTHAAPGGVKCQKGTVQHRNHIYRQMVGNNISIAACTPGFQSRSEV